MSVQSPNSSTSTVGSGDTGLNTVGDASSGLASVFSCFLTILCNAIIYTYNNQAVLNATAGNVCTPMKPSGLMNVGSPMSSKMSPGSNTSGTTFIPLVPLCSCNNSNGGRCNECREVASSATLRVCILNERSQLHRFIIYVV